MWQKTSGKNTNANGEVSNINTHVNSFTKSSFVASWLPRLVRKDSCAPSKSPFRTSDGNARVVNALPDGLECFIHRRQIVEMESNLS